MVEERFITYNDIEYIVSSDGHIYSTHNSACSVYHQEISQRENQDGYMVITTGPTGRRRAVSVHKLVALAFVPNPKNLPEINHKDFDRKNNDASNLEWCTHDDNIQYSVDAGHYRDKDICGEKNPNYGNHKLAEKYALNPELAKINNSRPGSQNGRARRMELLDIRDNSILLFEYTRAAAQYLVDNNYVRAKCIDAVSNRLSVCARKDCVCYKYFIPKFLD